MYFSALGVSAMPSARERRTVRRVRRRFDMFVASFSCDTVSIGFVSSSRQSRLAIDVDESWPLMSLFSRELRVIPPTVITTVPTTGQKRARQRDSLAEADLST